MSEGRQAHEAYQAGVFDREVEVFREAPPPEVLAKLERVVDAAPLGPGRRVLDVGTGTGVLLPFIAARGVTDLTACDVSEKMIAEAAARHPDVRFWHGDVASLPPSAHGFDAVFFNAVFGNLWNQEETLRATAGRLAPGGRIVVSHALGAAFVEMLHQRDPRMVPHLLPDEPTLQRWCTSHPPLVLERYTDDPDFYLAVLRRDAPAS